VHEAMTDLVHLMASLVDSQVLIPAPLFFYFCAMIIRELVRAAFSCRACTMTWRR